MPRGNTCWVPYPLIWPTCPKLRVNPPSPDVRTHVPRVLRSSVYLLLMCKNRSSYLVNAARSMHTRPTGHTWRDGSCAASAISIRPHHCHYLALALPCLASRCISCYCAAPSNIAFYHHVLSPRPCSSSISGQGLMTSFGLNRDEKHKFW